MERSIVVGLFRRERDAHNLGAAWRQHLRWSVPVFDGKAPVFGWIVPVLDGIVPAFEERVPVFEREVPPRP